MEALNQPDRWNQTTAVVSTSRHTWASFLEPAKKPETNVALLHVKNIPTAARCTRLTSARISSKKDTYFNFAKQGTVSDYLKQVP